MATTFADGTRVIVSIPDYSRWSSGAAASLDGMTGTVKQTMTPSVNSATFGGSAVLVKLDRTPKAWWSHQIPGDCWWFDPSELKAEHATERATKRATKVG